MKKPDVDPELIRWLDDRYPNGLPIAPQSNLNDINFQAGQRNIIEMLRHLSENQRTEF